MREALSKALAQANDASVDRVLAAAFYRTRQGSAGKVADVVRLSDRRDGFLAAAPQAHGGTRR